MSHSKVPSAKKLEAARHALEAAGMSVSKRNADSTATKRRTSTEPARKRRIAELENTRRTLEAKVMLSTRTCIYRANITQEKEEKLSLASLKKQKLKLEKQLGNMEKNIFPVADELISQLDQSGEGPTPLPIPVMKLDVPDELAVDVLYVWDFLHIFK